MKKFRGFYHHCTLVNDGKTVFAQFTNARSIHSGFYKRKTIDDNQKKFIPLFAIDNEFFQSVFFNPCSMQTEGAVRAVCTLLRIW
jgi:hypothetical protein